LRFEVIVDNSSIYVYTNLERLVALKYDIRGFSFLPKQPVQSRLTGKHRSRLRGRGLDFEEVRYYAFGDDIRAIDWKVTARTRKPHTKVYTEERERPVFLVVDQSSSMFFGSQQYMKSVIAAEAAALSAWKVLAVGDRIGGVVFNDESWEEVKPRRNQKAVLHFLRLIAEKNNQLRTAAVSDQNPEMLNEMLDKTARYVTHDFLVIILSDFSYANAQTIKFIKKITRHNDVIAGIVKDELEYRLTDNMIIGAGNAQINLREVSSEIKQKYVQNRKAELEKFKATLLNYRATPLEFNTRETVLTQIRRMLGGKRP